jgi:predicted nuclease of predicted toxin-antitoxin system
MKIKLDENIPDDLRDLLQATGHDVHTVPDEGLAGRDDAIVFAAATAEDRLLITQDLDFSDVRKFKPGTHPGIVLIRLQNPSRRRLIERIRQILDAQSIETWVGCFVIIGEQKLRIRRPQ